MVFFTKRITLYLYLGIVFCEYINEPGKDNGSTGPTSVDAGETLTPSDGYTTHSVTQADSKKETTSSQPAMKTLENTSSTSFTGTKPVDKNKQTLFSKMSVSSTAEPTYKPTSAFRSTAQTTRKKIVNNSTLEESAKQGSKMASTVSRSATTRGFTHHTSPNADFVTPAITEMTTPPLPPDSFYSVVATMTSLFPTTLALYYKNPDLQTMENYIKTNKTVIDYLAGFDNTYQRNVVETQLKICPYVPLCEFALGNIVTTQLSCCERCICDSRCLENRTCCPDVLHQSFSVISEMERKGISKASYGFTIYNDIIFPQCISKHLTVRTRVKQHGFYAIASCPEYSSAELRSNCGRPYSRDMGFTAFIPVFSNKTLAIYRNQYCALCNGVNDTDVVFFQPYFSCAKGQATAFDFSSEKDIIEVVFATQDCDITFKSHDERIELHYCQFSISMCNVTGLWKMYESHIEHACLVYRSLFHHERYTFQNVFCALCNGMTPHTVTCFYRNEVDADVFSFSGLIKLDHDQAFDATKIVGDDVTTCSVNQIFDSLMEECKDIHCSPMTRPEGGACVNIYDSIEGHIGYDFNVRLIPLGDVSLTTMFDIEINLYNAIKNLIAAMSRRLPVCDLIMAYTLGVKYRHGNSGKLENSVLSFAEARIHLAQHGIQKPWTITEELVSLHGSILSVENNSNTTIDLLLTLRSYEERVFNVIGAIVKTPTVLLSLKRSDNARDRLSIMSEYSMPSRAGLTIIPSSIAMYHPFTCYGDTEKDVDILRFQSCPKVNVSRHKYVWNDKSDGITIGDIEIKSSEYYHIDENHLMMCIDAFKRVISSLPPDRKLAAEVVVSVVSSGLSVVALIITAVVYCILPELRRFIPGKNNLFLVISLLIAQISLLVGSLNPFQQYSIRCKVIGLIIHFTWLISIFWMNVCTYHVFRTLSSTKLVSHHSGWKKIIVYNAYALIMAAIFVTANMIVATSVSGQLGYGGKFCYITSQSRILSTFVLPVFLVICANLAMYLIVIIRIQRSSDIKKNVQNERNDLVIYVKLSTITGITWVFGFLYILTNIPALSFIFIILNASQGVFIMFAVLVNRRVLLLFKTLTNRNDISGQEPKSGSKKPSTLTSKT